MKGELNEKEVNERKSKRREKGEQDKYKEDVCEDRTEAGMKEKVDNTKKGKYVG